MTEVSGGNRKQDKDAAAVRVFPPAVPLLTILLGLVLERTWPLGTACFDWAGTWRVPLGATIVASAVLGLGLWSVVIFRRSGQNENPWKPTPVIMDRGPFRITRNPMYLQMVLICVGVAFLAASTWVLLLTPLCAYALQRFAILPEEAYLERKFGETYLAYKRRVRRWL